MLGREEILQVYRQERGVEATWWITAKGLLSTIVARVVGGSFTARVQIQRDLVRPWPTPTHSSGTSPC
jgi:hypothetical protein